MAILKDLIVQGSSRHIGTSYFGYMYGFLTGYVDGNISGNAETASRWQTPRTFTIGNQSIIVDGARDITFTISTMGLQPAITLSGSQNNNGYMVSLGNNQNVIIPKPTTTSTYGVIKTAAASSKDKASLGVQTTALPGKYYGVVTTTDGFAYVNVNHPWKADGPYAASLYDCEANGQYSVAEGNTTTAFGDASHAEGIWSESWGDYSHAEGLYTTTTNTGEHAEGTYNVSHLGSTLHSIGIGTDNDERRNAIEVTNNGNMYLYGIGEYNGTSLNDAQSLQEYLDEFNETTAAALCDLSDRIDNINPDMPWVYGSGDGAGNATQMKYGGSSATGQYSVAEGNGAIASGVASHAEGRGAVASGDNSHAEGLGNALGEASHAEALGKALGDYSHSEGHNTTASGVNSHAEGIFALAYGHTSHAEGMYTLAYGLGSHAEGTGMITPVTANVPVVAMSGSNLDYTVSAANAAKLRIGYFLNYGISYARVTDISGTTVSLDSTLGTLSSASVKVLHGTSVGQYSHAEGLYATASGNYSHAEGSRTITYGNASHAEGYNSYTVGAVSHAEGEFTQTTNRAEHAEGRYNKSNKASVDFGDAGNTIHSVGIGNGINARKNAFEIMQNGNTYLIGVGNYDGTNINGSTTYTLQKCVDLWEPGTGEHSIQQKYSGAQATGKYSLAEGNNTVASGLASHAEGQATIAGPYSHAEGWSTLAKGGHSHAEGNNTNSINECSHSEGQGLYVTSTDDNTINNAWGYIITRHQKYTVFNQPHDIGNGEWSITITNIFSNNLADNKIKIKKAKYNPSIGDIIHYEQLSADLEISDFTRIKSIETDPLDSTYYLITAYSNNFTNRHNKTFTGTQQYVTNLKNQVSNNTFNEYIPSLWPSSNEYSYGIIDIIYGATLGLSSHSEGNMTCAIGDFSHSEGTYTKALNIAEHAQGSYNLSHWTNEAFGSANNTLFSIGCGTSSADRKNAIEVMQNGDVYVKGVGNYEGTSIENINTLQDVVNAGGGGGGNAGNSKVFYGTCDTVAATVAKVVDCDDFTSSDLVEGVMVIVKFSATNSGAVANLTLNVNGTGAKGIRKIYADSGVTTLTNAAELAANAPIPFIYNGTYWVVAGLDYNTNTIGYQLRTGSSTLPMKNYTGRYRLLFTSADGENWVASTTSTSTNASAARTPTTEKIDPFGEIVYYGSTTAISAGSNPRATVLWQQYTISLGYSFTASTLSYPKPVYIKCTPQSDGSAIIDADMPYVQTLPSTEDGKIYIFLGIAYDATHVELTMNHPVYYYSNGKIRIWTGAETIESIPSSGYGQVKSIEVCQTPGDNPNTLYIVL